MDINSVQEENRGAKEDGGVTCSTGKTCREDMEYDVSTLTRAVGRHGALGSTYSASLQHIVRVFFLVKPKC